MRNPFSKNKKTKKALDVKSVLSIESKKLQDQAQQFLRHGRNQEGLAIFLVGVFTLVIAYGVVRPVNVGYRQTKIGVANFRQEKALLLEKQEKLKNLGKTLQEEKDFIFLVEKVLPKTQEIPELLIVIDEIAAKNTLLITNFSPREREEEVGRERNVVGNSTTALVEQGLKIVDIQFDLTGGYTGLKQFIEDLERNIRPVHIETINVVSGGVSQGVREPIRFNITAKAYYQP